MSISTVETKVTYAGNSSTVTPYPIPFKYLEEAHINLYIDGVLQVLGAAQDYVLAGDGTIGTGSLTTKVAQDGTKSLVIVLDVPLDQPVVLQETSSLPAKVMEVEGFDRLNMQIRRVWRKLGDALTFSTDEANGSTGTANNLLGFDGSGDIAEIPNSTFVQTADGLDGNGDVTITTPSTGQVLSWNGSAWVNDVSGNGDALTTNGLDQFAATSSLELKDTISDETGSGALVFATSPALVTPNLGTPSAVDLINATNTPLPAAGTVTEVMLNTSANLSLDKADTSMQPTTYDPNTVAGDAFDSANHTYTPAGTGAVDTVVETKLRESVSVKDFGAVGDGVADDTAKINAALAAVISDGSNTLAFVAGETYLTTASIPNLHDVRHIGGGSITRGSDTFTIARDRDTVQLLYVNTTGSDTNDGLTSSQPVATIQRAVDIVKSRGKVIGRQKIIIAAGTYTEQVNIPDGLVQAENYMEFIGATVTDITAATLPTTILNGLSGGVGLGSTGFNIGRYNKVAVSYILFKDWREATASTDSDINASVYRALGVDEYSFAYIYGCYGTGNGLTTFDITPESSAVITGGVITGGKRAIQNIGGSLSLTATASTYTTIDGALEYGLYQKHDSRTVADYTQFKNCGDTAAAAGYGAAVFVYKTGASFDPRNVTYTNNHYVYNLRSGHLGRKSSGDTYSGNDFIYKVNSLGDDDWFTYETVIGRSLLKSGAEISTSQTSYSTLLLDSAIIPAGYFVYDHQYLDIYIAGTNDGGGTANVRPLLLLDSSANASIGVFDVPANTYFNIQMRIRPVQGGASQVITFNNTGATISSQATQDLTSSHDFATKTVEFKLDGLVSVGTNTLTYHNYSATLWG